MTKQKRVVNKLEIKKLPTFYTTRVGDRTLTPTQKRKFKEEKGFKCEICKKKFDSRLLEIHHKKEVAKHKNPMGFDMPIFTMGKKHIPVYDKRRNLQVVCLYCHDKTKKKKPTTKKKTPKKPKSIFTPTQKWVI